MLNFLVKYEYKACHFMIWLWTISGNIAFCFVGRPVINSPRPTARKSFYWEIHQALPFNWSVSWWRTKCRVSADKALVFYCGNTNDKVETAPHISPRSYRILTIWFILNHLTMEYWKITGAIFPSRQSIFPSELLKLPWQSPLLVNTRKYSSSRAGPMRVRIPPREYTDPYWSS